MQSSKERIKEILCPNCEGGCRYLYRLKNTNIVLMCEECNATWLDQEHINWGEAVSDKELEVNFDVENSEYLFDEGCSNWATQDEVKKTNWKFSFIKTQNYSL